MGRNSGKEAKHAGTHERLIARETAKTSSDRAFGLVFAGVFTIVGLWPLLAGEGPRWWSLAIALAFAALAVLRPALLTPLNRLWTHFGLLLNRVVSPLVMGLLFYGVITPFALVLRAAGKDLLHLHFDPGAESYWIARQPPGPAAESIRNQF